MGYEMLFEGGAISVAGEFFSDGLLESSTMFKDNQCSIELLDISLKDFHIIQGKQSAKKDSAILINFEHSFFVTHFVLSSRQGQNSVPANSNNTYSAYYQNKDQSEQGAIDAGQHYEFLELAFRQSFLQSLIDQDQPYSDALYSHFHCEDYSASPRLPILPEMHQCISDISKNEFSGSLQQLYLETKATELFLLQVQAFQKGPGSAPTKLKNRDIELLHQARLYVEQNYHEPCTIIDLARRVGMNQTKLKNGFKELFGNTIFGYLRDLQMEKARQLLLDEKMYVNEVSDQVGYKHPQHFAAAFKRKFGILPSELK